MIKEKLSSFPQGTTFETDLVIVGGGAAGLTVAREFFCDKVTVLIVESGLEFENPRHESLNKTISIGEPASGAQRRRRVEFHGANATEWSAHRQQFGVRCRALGGSTHAWAGKCAALDDIDFSVRRWVRNSGWPIRRETLDAYLDRAAEVLNLGPNCYNDEFWQVVGIQPPEPQFDPTIFSSYFWQFARSRVDHFDVLRFGSEFADSTAPNVRLLLDATVTRIEVDPTSSAFQGLQISTVDGQRSTVKARAAVLAASGIENPRLLLASNNVQSCGVGNRHDNVGRFLMDHPSSRIGRFNADKCSAVARRFGFYGARHGGRTHMYMHGLTPSTELQEREGMLNCAVYMLEERAPDDPWDALKRLLRANMAQPVTDIASIAKGSGLLVKGIGRRILQSNAIPQTVTRSLIDTVIRFNANFAANEYQSRGLPHKLTGLHLDAISEQEPDPESRITLSEEKDALGIPLACVNWRIDNTARWSLLRLGELIAAEFPRVGLPSPELEHWIVKKRPQDSVIIDMAHSLGTTRMSDDPKQGVVDTKCRVHDVAGLYVAGGSIFPTSGHANPTLTILALAIRLADQIKLDLNSCRVHAPVSVSLSNASN